jgi:type IV pilus assembly protein PilM
MKNILKNVLNPLYWLHCAYRLFHRRAVTLNIEGGAIRVLAMDGKRVTAWGSLPLPPGLVRDGLVVDPVQVGSLVRAFVADNEMSRNRVNASVTGMRSLPRLLSLPKVKGALVPEAIRHESERQMPVPLDELHLCWRNLGSNGSESQFFVVGVPRGVLDAEIQTLAQAGIKEHVLDLKPMALARAVNRSEAVIIDLEPDSSHIVLVVQGIPMLMRTLILGGEGVSPQDKATQAAAEVARTVEFHNLSHPGQSISSMTSVFLTGGLATDDSLADAVSAAIDNPIEKLAPVIECPAELPVAEYAVNIGLALKGSAARRAGGAAASPALDLPIAPNGYGPRPQRKRILSYAVLAGLVIALLFPPAFTRRLIGYNS